MHLTLSTSLLQLPKQVCLPRPSFAQSPLVEEKEKDDDKVSLAATHSLEPYAIFPHCSVNLISCCSNSGKTRFLQEVIRHRQKFFQNPESLRRVIFVNCNQRDFSIQHPWATDDQETQLKVQICSPVTCL